MPVAQADDDAPIAYTVRGDGPHNLIFLHAWGCSGHYFTETIDELDPATVRSVAVDFRGHGDSDKRPIELTWDRLAADVIAVADHAGVGTFVAVGHSLGGKLAQYLPLAAPTRVRGLVLIASPWAAELPLPDAVARWSTLAGDSQGLIDHTVRPWLTRAVSEHVLRRFGEHAAKIPREYLESTLRLVSETSFIDRMRSVHTPALVIETAGDPIHTPARDLLDSLADARLHTIDSGPEIPMEAPVELARTIERFLDGLTA